MSALFALLLAGTPAPALPLPQPAAGKIDAGLAACASREGWSAAQSGQGGWARGASYSLVARGQRAHEFQHPESGSNLTLHSSFILYVACSTSVDLAAPDEETPVREALVARFGLKKVQPGDLALSDNAKAFMREYKLDGGPQTFANDVMAYSFFLRQFNGRNIFAVYAIELERPKG